MNRLQRECKSLKDKNCAHLLHQPPPMRIGDCGDTIGADGVRRKSDGSIGKTESSGPALLAIVIFVFCAGIACGWQMNGGGL